jgi:ubiquinone/menaquinone biosynthesis C-methylase UbiE
MPEIRSHRSIAERQYQDAALVDIYDQLNPLGRDSDYFISACAPTSRSVLDLGCGTGLLSATLAALGHEVLGVDPSEEMLRIARLRSDLPNMSWHRGDARCLDLNRLFDRVTATGHVFQVFLNAADKSAFLRAAQRHLTEDGLLIFDTRNPAAAPWINWTPERSMRQIDHDLHGRVAIWHETTSVASGIVTFKSNYRFLDRGWEITSDSKLAFPSVEELRKLLECARLDLITLHGDWDGGAFTDSSPEIIVTARPSHASL